jgi:hypothetical protein
MEQKDEGNMARAKLNSMFQSINGSVDGVVFRWLHGGQVVGKMPDMSKVKWSKAQKAHRQRFKQAVAYARSAMAEPTVRARYEQAAAKQGRRPFDLAVSDYFKGRNLLEK